MTGWLPFEKLVEIAPLDTEATEEQGVFDHDLKEKIPVDPNEDGKADDPAVLKDTITILAGVERDRGNLQQMTTGGNVPDGAVGLVIMTYRLANKNLFDEKGHPTICVNARLLKEMNKDGTPVKTYDGNPYPCMYCHSVDPAQADLGGSTNAWLFLFADHPKG